MCVSTMIASCASFFAASVAGAACSAPAMHSESRVKAIRRIRVPPRFNGSDETCTAHVDGIDELAPEPVAKLGGVANAPAYEVRAHPRAQYATVLQTECTRAVDGGPAQRFDRREAEMGAGQLHRLAQREQRRSAGIAVGGHGHRHAVFAEGIERRQLGVA